MDYAQTIVDLIFCKTLKYYKTNTMRKLIIALLTVISIITVHPRAYASSTAIPSATLKSSLPLAEPDNRVNVLREYLTARNSHLASEAETFVAEADTYNLDYRLVAAICGNESQYGLRIPYNSYNGWGWGVYGDHVTYFSSWKEGIHTVSKELRERYMDKWGVGRRPSPPAIPSKTGETGEEDYQYVYEIGKIYAADPAWARKVTYYMDDIEAFGNKPKQVSINL